MKAKRNSQRDTSPPWRGCPIRFAMGIFGDKWTLLIVRDLMFKGRKYFGDFQNAGEGIATNILSDRLAGLERNGIITKKKDPQNRVKNIYSLTRKGLDLMPVMLAIIDWSQKYDEHTQVPGDFIEGFRKNPDKFTKRLLDKLSSSQP